MKRTIGGILILIVFCLLLPVLVTACALQDSQLIIRGYEIQSLLFGGCAVLITAKLYRNSDLSGRKSIAALLGLLTLVSSINLYFALFHSISLIVTAAAAVNTGCAFFLLFRCGKAVLIQVIVWTLCLLLLFPFVGCAFLMLTFGQIGQNTVVQTALSPSGVYRAEVIDSDQGALGGDTIVQVVHLEKRLDLGLCIIQKKPTEIYTGEWGECLDMQIQWASDNSLLINNRAYPIPE